jgi:DHA2 family multidrug resistance protein-like MFS transporter
MGAGLALAGIGLAILTQVGHANGLPVVVLASVVISLGLAPVFGLTTELIVGSAPPERAGAASGISETGAELGGALGISILGSIGVAIYRGRISTSLPDGVPTDAAVAARDTLGAAAGIAHQLPADVGAALLDVARQAFVAGMQVAAALSVAVAIGVAVLALVALRNVEAGGQDDDPDADAESATDRQEPAGRPALTMAGAEC